MGDSVSQGRDDVVKWDPEGAELGSGVKRGSRGVYVGRGNILSQEVPEYC